MLKRLLFGSAMLLPVGAGITSVQADDDVDPDFSHLRT